MRKDLLKKQIFEMIARHKITTDEGFRLLKALRNPFNSHHPRDLPVIGEDEETNSPPGEIDTILSTSLLERAQQDLVKITANIANINERDFDPDEDLQVYGFDSLSLTQLADRINQTYNTTIMPTLFFELSPPTLGSLVLYLFSQYRDCFSQYYHGDIPVENIEIEADGELVKENQRDQAAHSREPIAIIGMSGVMPQSENLEVFWNHLEAGNDLITEVPGSRWDWNALTGEIKSARWGGFIKDVDAFDAEFFGISPREAVLMDPQHRIFLETVWKTIEDAGYSISDLSGKKIGVFVGVSGLDYLDVLISHSVTLDAHALSGISHAILANRISYLFNFHGPNEAVDTACSSSLVALNHAIQSIHIGACEMAAAGGVNLILSPRWVTAFHNSGMLSDDGRCKTFARGADGYVRSEGAGAVFLKPLSRAETDGDHIYAVIIGTAENHGGHAQSLTAPNANAQAALLIDAYKNASIDPTTVTYIETHGTGTELGDPIEINGLKKAFSELHKQNQKPIPGKPYCGIGSVKTNIGHLETAAGIAGVLKVLLAIKHKKLPATVHFKKQNPYIDLEDTPFYIVSETRAWDCLTASENRIIPRRAGISSFGFGGTNVHVVLEEYHPPQQQPTPTAPRNRESQIIVLSAKNEDRLKAYAGEMIRFLEKNQPLAATSRQLQSPQESPEKTREQLLKITARILKVNENDIDVDEELNECGFDEVNLAGLARQINDIYNMAINVSTFCQHSSINALVHHLCREEPVDQDKPGSLSTDSPGILLERIAYTLHMGRKPMEARLAVVVSDIDELKEKLNAYYRDTGLLGKRFYSGSIDSNRTGPVPIAGETPENERLKDTIKNRDLEDIAQSFVAGADINWSWLYPDRKPRRISLPTYPFERKKYWVGSLPGTGNNKEHIVKNNHVSASTGKPRLRLKGLPGSETPMEETITKNPERPLIVLKKTTAVQAQQDNHGSMEPGHDPVGKINEIANPSFNRAKQDENNESPGEVKASLQDQVKKILAKVLFMEPARIDENRAFTELGLDSILAVEFSRKLNEVFQVEIKATKLYDYSTVIKLAQYLSSLGIKSKGETNSPLSKDQTTPVLMEEDHEETGALLGPRLKEILAAILFMDPAKVDDNKAFMEMGLDSILAVEFSKKLNETFRVDIKATKLYEYSTINKLKHCIVSHGVKTGNEKISTINNGKAVTTVKKERETESPAIREESFVQPGLPAKSKDIAIIGMSVRFPGADNISQYWQNLKNGVDSVTEVPPDRWDVDKYYDPEGNTPGKTASKWGGFLGDIDKFDPLFFNISPAEAELLDPQQRLFLQEAWRAIEDAGYGAESLNNVKCGVYVGVMSGIEYPSDSMFNAHSILASRISYLLNLKGPTLSIDTACSSSLVAMHLACRSLLEGETEMMLTGGVSLYLTEKPYIGMTRMGDILSRTGKCKTFDNSADGFIPGEGVGVVVLKLLDKAIAAGDHIYGVIKGSGMNQDGRTNGITAPSAESQKELELEVYKKYGIDPGTISYVEAHGTGTKLGDPIEVEALTEAFRQYTRKKQYCPIGSVKTNLGHTSAAAGAASVIKVLLSMKHKKIPPSLHFHQENEHINFKETPFYVNTRLSDWTPPGAFPRRAAVSSFGYSGTNVHMIVEEPPGLDHKYSKSAKSNQFYFIPVSARTEEALRKRFEDLNDWLNHERNDQEYSPADIAYTLGVGRSHFPVRAALVARDTTELKHALVKIAKGETPANYFMNKINKADPSNENMLGKAAAPLLDELRAFDKLSENEYKDKLTKLAELYIKGYGLDGGLFYPGNGCKRISLPTYPFAKQRCWIPLPEKRNLDMKTTGRPDESINDERDIQAHIKKDLVKWVERILKVEEKDVDVEGSLLEYGFDSITFTEYIKQINREYDIKVAVESVFDLKNPTITSLAGYLSREFKEPLLRYFRPGAESPGVSVLPGHMNVSTGAEPIAIIGISGMMPSSDNLESFWKHLEEGKQLLTGIPGDRWDTVSIPAEGLKGKRGGFLKGVDLFDAEFFGFSPGEAALMDPQQRLFLVAAWRALEDAGYKPSTLYGTPTGVFVGVSASGYERMIKTANPRGKVDPRQTGMLSAPSMVAHRISYHLNLYGPSEALDTTVSGSLAALHLAVETLQNGKCTLAIAGGVHILLDPARLLEQDSQPDGYIPGEGVGAAVFKPLSTAIADEDHIYAVIKSSTANHAGRDLPFLNAPGYIEVYGPGFNSNGGEPLEIKALKTAVVSREGNVGCGVGSLTSDIGNLEAASGIAALFKILLAVKHKKIPTSHFGKSSNTPWNLEGTPFYLVNKTCPWECLTDEKNQLMPRRAGLSAFGYSGAVAHVLLEEYMDSTAPTNASREESPQIIVLSAKNTKPLKAYARKMKDFLEEAAAPGSPAAPGPKFSTSPGKERNWRQQIEDDVLQISNKTLKTDAQGYKISSIRTFIRRLNKTFKLDITEDLFKAQPSIGALVKYLRKRYKKELEGFYNNPDKSRADCSPRPSPSLNLEDIAYTLQVGREAMAERMAITVCNIGELKEKLDAFCRGKRKIENLFTGNIDSPRGQVALLMEGEEKDKFLKSLIKNRKLAKLGYCWVLGVEIHWQALYPERIPRRISLPTYPFENKRCWPDSPRKQKKSKNKTS